MTDEGRVKLSHKRMEWYVQVLTGSECENTRLVASAASTSLVNSSSLSRGHDVTSHRSVLESLESLNSVSTIATMEDEATYVMLSWR